MNSLPQAKSNLVRCIYHDPAAVSELGGALRAVLAGAAERRRVVVVCVGTDRSTGDSLGPLTGLTLVSMGYPAELVYGTVDDPVHAGNLADAVRDLRTEHPGSLVVAVDACLGTVENVGTISLCQGPLRPGAGVNKALPPVGELAITGVVNVAGFMEYFVLQNTRLSLVIRMSQVIAAAIMEALGLGGVPQAAVGSGLEAGCAGSCSRRSRITEASST